MTQFETHKFGGTSLGDKQRIKAAADIIRTERDPSCMSLVVASAIGGATNALLKTVDEGVLPTLVSKFTSHTLYFQNYIVFSVEALRSSRRCARRTRSHARGDCVNGSTEGADS